jgi:hypothetical protein
MSPRRQWWRNRVATFAFAVAFGIALWLSCGRLFIVDQQADLAVRLLPPLWIQALTILIGLIAASWHSTPHRSLLLLPAGLLALPWLATAFSPLKTAGNLLPSSVFLWLGPVVPLVWATLLGAWLADLRIDQRAPRVTAAALRLLEQPARAQIFAICCAFALFACAAFRLAPWLPEGDEPHYLVITQSLLRDGDLAIENNHAAGQYREYTARDLKPDYLRRGTNGQIYSIHAPGLPALVLPAFAIAGYRGVTLFLALIAACGSALAWRVCWLVTGRASAAWIGWAAVTGSSPFVFHAFTIYPDGVAAVIVLTGVLALARIEELTDTRAFLHGGAVSVLPWLHTRYAILAATLGAIVVWRLRLTHNAARVRRVAAFLALPACSAMAWFTFFQVIYGTLDPTAPYGSATRGSWETLPNGVAGLLFDQQFGLMANAPIYAIALIGLIWLMSRRDRLAWEIAMIALPYTLATAAFPMWWGGWSAPARFLVPLVLVLSIPIAMVWRDAKTLATRASVGVALGVTVWLTVLMLTIQHGRIVYNERDGYALWADWAGPVLDLAQGLPSLFRGGWVPALACAMVWGAALGVAWLVLRELERRLRDALMPMFMTAIAPTVFGVAVMIALAMNGAGLRAAQPHNASPFRPPAQQAMQYEGVGRVYALGEGVYLEPGGFWIEPGDDRLVLIVPSAAARASALKAAAEAAQLRVAVRNGQLPNRATLKVDRWQRELTLQPKAEMTVEMPTPAAAADGRMLLRMRVERGVRPSDLDPANGDRRLLGLWVELR